MANIVLHRLAQQDFEKAFDWYAERSPRAALEFDMEVAATMTRIVAEPERFTRLDGRHRYCMVSRFPYLVVFRVREQQVIVVAVAHARRRAYWKRRSTD